LENDQIKPAVTNQAKILQNRIWQSLENIFQQHKKYKYGIFYYPTVDNWPPAANQWGKRRKLNSLADITTARDSLRARGDQGMTGSARTVTLAPSTRPAQPDLFRPDDSA
jgi:hypothetical protein